jgi:iron complex transport system ATP-binding protein
MTLLAGKDIGFSYGRSGFSLKSISLSIDNGEVVSLLGPNGAGKTTLIKIFSGLVSGYTGSVMLGQKELKNYGNAGLARLISYIPQADSYTFDFTVGQIVAMGRRPYMNETGILSKHDMDRVKDALDSFGIYEKRDAVYNNLSGGEKRMVLIARAIAQEAEMLLMDEPMTFLDLHHQAALMETIMGLNSAGKTIFMISHGINLASEYVKRVVLMKDGAIRADGTPGNVITQENMKNIFSMENFYIESNKLSKRPNVFIVPGIPDGLSGPDGV